jgi:hypothetical protein
MSLIVADNPLVKNINSVYSKKILQFSGFEIAESVGKLHKVIGFDNYNQLLNINSLFSSSPAFDPVDRTNLAQGPIVFSPQRAWSVPHCELSLETAMEQRVTDLCKTGQKINLFWSGGIDSTAIVVAFLKYAPDLKQCRIIYTPWSTYEHLEFFTLLKTVDNIELIDISGDVYLSMDLDGIFVSGNGADEIHASLDESFYKQYGYEFLSTSWKDFFYNKKPDTAFIEFCEQHFALSGQEIRTVLEARWWFYTSCKLTSILNNHDLVFLSSGPVAFDPGRLVGFFDCQEYEQFIYFNLDKIINTDNYARWKQFLKDFCYSYDGFNDWRENKTKFHSTQVYIYCRKKQILNDSRHLMLLSNGQKVTADNLPLFSSNDWNQIRQKYQYVFRDPNTIPRTLA